MSHPRDPHITNPAETPSNPLVTQLAAGDVNALRAIMALHWERLVALATTIIGARDLAQEAVQDAFVQTWNARTTLDASRPILGFLMTVTSRRARDIMRRERGHSRIVDAFALHLNTEAPATQNSGEHALGAMELDVRVAATLATLPNRCREIFLLHQDARMSHAEIAVALGLSLATVRNQVSRATQAIAKTIADWRAGN